MNIARVLKEEGIKVTLDKDRFLIFDLNAFCEIEDKYGSLDKGMTMLLNGSIKAVRFFLFAAMKHEDETLTEKEVGQLVTLKNIDYVRECLNKAMEDSLPEPEVGKNE